MSVCPLEMRGRKIGGGCEMSEHGFCILLFMWISSAQVARAFGAHGEGKGKKGK